VQRLELRCESVGLGGLLLLKLFFAAAATFLLLLLPWTSCRETNDLDRLY
jgi:hypothetical protein